AHSSNLPENKNAIPRQLREIWPWIAAFLLLVLCAEWWLFSRNYQSQGATSRRTGARAGAVGAELAPTRAPTTPNRVTLTLKRLQEYMQQRYVRFEKQKRKITKRIRGKRNRATKG